MSRLVYEMDNAIWGAQLLGGLMFRSLMFLSFLGGGLFSGAVPTSHAETVLQFGVYSSDSPSAMVKQFRPILRELEKEILSATGEPTTIKLQVYKEYEQGIDAIVDSKVDFARLGPASYVNALKRNPGISILALENKKGTKEFNGLICVKEDSPIQSVADLKGHSFAFGNELSTIGRYLAQLHMLEQGIRAGDLSSYEYLDRHDKVGMAVATGAFEAGALKESTMKKLVSRGRPLRTIAVFPNVTKPWVVRSGLDQQITELLRQKLLTLTDEEVLSALGKDGFLEGRDSDYQTIREAMDKNLDFFQPHP